MVWWQQDVERPLTLELRWVMEPSVAVLVEVWTATYTATAAPPPSLDESALLRETYKRLTLFMRGLYTTLRALPATQVRNVERHIAFVFFLCFDYIFLRSRSRLCLAALPSRAVHADGVSAALHVSSFDF
jgi:hypothetical protein